MSEHGKAQVQTIAAGFLGFVAVVAVGILIVRRGGVSQTPPSEYAPVNTEALSAPVSARLSARSGGAAYGETAAATASPAPTTGQDARILGAASANSANAAGDSAALQRLAAGQHLTASAGNAPGTVKVANDPEAPVAMPSSTAAKKPFVAPKLDLAKTSVASTVHYGVSNRNELMGRAAGPVYNFSGAAGGGQKGQLGQLAGQANGQVDAATQQINDSALTPEDKAKLLHGLGQVRTSVTSTGGSGN